MPIHLGVSEVFNCICFIRLSLHLLIAMIQRVLFEFFDNSKIAIPIHFLGCPCGGRSVKYGVPLPYPQLGPAWWKCIFVI